MSASANILVLFDTATQATAKMAEFVSSGARSVSGAEVRMVDVRTAAPQDVIWCDGLALGSPTNLGLLSWRMKKFWDEDMLPHWSKIDGKIGCAFTSSGGWGGGGELACQSMMTLLINYGFLVFGVTDYVSPTLTLHYGAITAKQPRDEGAKKSCELLGRKLAENSLRNLHRGGSS